MPLTRADAEQSLVSRLRVALAQVGRSTDDDGSNVDLNDAIASMLEVYGILPSIRSDVSDADLANLDDSIRARFIDECEIRALQTLVNDIALKPRYQQWDDYRVDRNNQVEALRQLIAFKVEQFHATHDAQAGGVRAVAVAPPVRGILGRFDCGERGSHTRIDIGQF